MTALQILLLTNVINNGHATVAGILNSTVDKNDQQW
jgi:hypothetical protein